MNRRRALGSVALGALCFGTLGIAVPLAYRAGVQPLPLITWRFFFSFLVMGGLALARNRDAFRVPKRDIFRYFIISVVGYGAASLLYFLALKRMSPAVAASLLYAYPALVALGARFIFGEALHRNRVLAVCAVIVGCGLIVGLIGGGHVHVTGAGIALAVGSAFAYAAFNLMSQKWLPGRSSMTMMSFVFAFNALVFGLLTVVFHGSSALLSLGAWSARAWWIVLFIVAFPTVIGLLLYLKGVRKLGAAEAAIVSTLEPLFTVVFSGLLLHEHLTIVQWIGFLLIVGGVAAASIVRRAPEPSPVTPLTDDEVVPRDPAWVGPDGERPPAYVLDEIAAGGTVRFRRSAPVESEQDRRGRAILRWGLFAIGALMLLVIIMVSTVLLIVGQPAPNVTLKAVARRTSQPNYVYDGAGTQIATLQGKEQRTLVSYRDITTSTVEAVVSIEDRRFYSHGGVDVISIMRAVKRNTEEGVIKQGGSTITQQLIKMMYTGGERTFSRKVNEAIMATRAEMTYSKETVLESYLNMAYYGQGAYGIGNAARIYFDKLPQELTTADSALLAGMVRSPSAFDAFNHPRPVLERRNLVLKAMHDEGNLSTAEYLAARRQPLGLKRGLVGETAHAHPYFIDYVRRSAIAAVGEKRFDAGGLRIRTTLDAALQARAEKEAAAFSAPDEPTVSIVSVRRTDGGVLALVGGRDWTTNQFNIAIQGRRQPGSAFKPITLITALEHGVALSDRFDSAPYTTRVKDGIWRVSNYSDSSGSGMMTLHDATVHSVNTVYARLVMKVGADRVAQTARSLGFTAPINADPAIALGGLTYGVSPLEMAAAYGTMANRGTKVTPTPLVEITDADGAVLYRPATEQPRVFSRATGDKVAVTLHDVVESGTGQGARIDAWSAGKTGTTQSYRDAWFVGWSGKISTAVWMGYPEGQVSMDHVRGQVVTGGSFPARIWAAYMTTHPTKP